MPRLLPPIDKRFPVNRPHAPHKGFKGPYLTPLIKKFLNKKINFEDPETQKIIRGRVKDAVIWRLILNATQGENEAIKEIIDRIDGKSKSLDPLVDNSTHYHFTNLKNEHLIDEARRRGITIPAEIERRLGANGCPK